MADEDVQGQQEEGRGARIAGTAIVAVGVVALIFAHRFIPEVDLMRRIGRLRAHYPGQLTRVGDEGARFPSADEGAQPPPADGKHAAAAGLTTSAFLRPA